MTQLARGLVRSDVPRRHPGAAGRRATLLQPRDERFRNPLASWNGPVSFQFVFPANDSFVSRLDRVFLVFVEVQRGRWRKRERRDGRYCGVVDGGGGG